LNLKRNDNVSLCEKRSRLLPAHFVEMTIYSVDTFVEGLLLPQFLAPVRQEKEQSARKKRRAAHQKS
jgi:hypothetical protein